MSSGDRMAPRLWLPNAIRALSPLVLTYLLVLTFVGLAWVLGVRSSVVIPALINVTLAEHLPVLR